ncbi:integrase catalytic domain-containing protein [Trichonephila clavipes]|nr:integrase catalytic domain-containing protein [Trichonephila clavipes]
MCADKESAKLNDENTVVSSSVLSNQSVNETLYLQTLVLRIEHNGKELNVRTILDSGSQKSYISERVIKVLQLRPKSKQIVVHGLFEGEETSPHSHLVFYVYLKNFEDIYAHSIEGAISKKICGQWEDLQIIEEVPKTEVDNFGYYLPHRPIMKQASRDNENKAGV